MHPKHSDRRRRKGGVLVKQVALRLPLVEYVQLRLVAARQGRPMTDVVLGALFPLRESLRSKAAAGGAQSD